MKSKIYIILSLLIFCSGIFAQEFPFPNIDFKYHRINNVKLAVSNTGDNQAGMYGIAGFDHLLIYPKSSTNRFIAYNGFWLGAVVDGDTLCSVSAAYVATGEPSGDIHEFSPKFDKKHILYSTNIFEKQHPDIDPNTVVDFFNEDGTLSDNYYPLSHEDIISQYYDNQVTQNTAEAPDLFRYHVPMDAHIIQRSFAWAIDLYNDCVFIDYFVINESESVWKDVCFAVYSDPHSYNFDLGSDISDDVSYWDPEGEFLVQGDHPGTGGDDMPNNELIGYDILGMSLPGESVSLENLNRRFWSWEDGPDDPNTNEDYYRQICKDEIDRRYTPDTYGSMRGLMAKGPYPELAPGDTIRITVVVGGGAGVQNLRKQMFKARKLYETNFQVPKAPNPPKFTIKPVTNGVELDWYWYDHYEGYKPEYSIDNSRNDGVVDDFDGFRIYRSEDGEYGPWTLVAQYDSINGSGFDSGLQYKFTDTGLKNGLKYSYAVTSFDMRDDVAGVGPLESPKNYLVLTTMPGPNPEDNGDDEVYAVPNPYRGDVNYASNPKWEYPTQDLRTDWYEIDRRIAFMNLPSKCKITIFTVNGIKVNTIEHDRNQKGHNIASWNLLNNNNHAVGSGIYYFVVEGQQEDKGFSQVGKFVIVK